MDIIVEAYTDRGCLRENNEDHILIGDKILNHGNFTATFNSEMPLFFAVADGIGGHKAGEVASWMVLNSLKDFSADLLLNEESLPFETIMNEWFYKTDLEIKIAGGSDPSKSGMGTTLAGLFIYRSTTFVFNAGDSRVYLFDGNKIDRLTKDHTQQDRFGFRSHMLTNCVGPSREPFLELTNIRDLMVKGSKFLICSDGLTDMISEETIASAMANGRQSKLVELAKDAGGNDNISVIIVEMS